MAVKTYRAKPVLAVQWKEDNVNEIKELITDARVKITNGNLFIYTHRGVKFVEPGAYIVLEVVTQRIYPLNPTIFLKLFEEWNDNINNKDNQDTREDNQDKIDTI